MSFSRPSSIPVAPVRSARPQWDERQLFDLFGVLTDSFPTAAAGDIARAVVTGKRQVDPTLGPVRLLERCREQLQAQQPA